MIGESYLGLTQWAVAAGESTSNAETADGQATGNAETAGGQATGNAETAGGELAALSIHASASQFHGQTFPGGSLALETSAQWLVIIALQERRPVHLPMLAGLAQLRLLLTKQSLKDLDLRLAGGEVGWFREALAAPEREDSFWAERDFSAGVADVTAQVQMVAGWYDAFLPWQLEDFAVLQHADRPRQLIIGPWSHVHEGMAAAGFREGIAWLHGHLLGDRRRIKGATVRLFVTGERSGGGWRDFANWPPAETPGRQLWITDNDRLSWEPPVAAAGSRSYRYDPAKPTPSVGGSILLTSKPVRNNRRLEARADVLTFTTDPLAKTLEAIGPVRVQLWARASEPYFDLFARVCDVDPEGTSRNVCDALTSIAPGRYEQAADGTWQVRFDLWPMAHRFAAGHRIRLQVSSGAHPRYARNPGTGEPPLSAERLVPVDVELCYGERWPAALFLPPAAPSGNG
jgi:putative CocE/NonD family hydrolase